MEQETRKCPYCGEEILVVAKKCKHCGEWLESEVREDSFDPRFLYWNNLLNLLFWVTIIGSFIGFLHTSGWGDGMTDAHISGRGRIIQVLAQTPEWMGDLLSNAGTIVFTFLLMRVFSHLHKPLTAWFIASMVGTLLVAFIQMAGESSEPGLSDIGLVFAVVFGLGALIIDIVLGILIINNYEGKIKQLGWIMVGYTAVSMLCGLLSDSINSTFPNGLVSLVLDVLYLWYLCNLLSKE